MGQPRIVAEGLRKEFPQSKATLVAVDDVSFEVHPGEIVGLLGPNGAGKTTTLRMLVGLTQPTAGTARIAGHDVRRAPLQARASLGYLSASSGLPPRLTVREVLETLASIQGVTDARGAADRAVEIFKLGEFSERVTSQLSTGMLQRTRIAAAAVHSPPVLVLDEPTAGLDVVAAAELMRFVLHAREQGVAVLFSTHILSEVEESCDRVAVLSSGRIRATGTPAELAERTGAPDLKRAFLALVSDP